jgi:hypothetical protein
MTSLSYMIKDVIIHDTLDCVACESKALRRAVAVHSPTVIGEWTAEANIFDI